MNITILPNGNLKMQVSDELEKRPIRRMRGFQTFDCETRFVKLFLGQHGYKTIKPEECGALTSATIITDGKDVWGDMSYQVQSFIQELSAGNPIYWIKG